MKRLFISVLAVALSVCASGQSLYGRFVDMLGKSGIQATIVTDDGIEGTACMEGNRFRYLSDQTSLWFDGTTLWRGVDCNTAMGEIYITTPSPDEQFVVNPLKALRLHEGFSVSDDSKSTITLKALQESVQGITKVTIKVNPNTLAPTLITVQTDPAFQKQSIEITVREFKTDVKLDKDIFTCKPGNYPDAEVIDLR